MGLVKGLKSINERLEAQEAKAAKRSEGSSERTRWFKIKDGQTVKVRFLQELAEDSVNFSAKNGIGFLSVEHANPKDYTKKALCTIDDEGVCWACEQHELDWSAGWKQKSRIYINVLVDDSEEEPYVAILSQGISGRSITPTLLEFAQGDEDTEGTITDKWFKIKRKGKELSDTFYTLLPGAVAKDSVEDYDVIDLERAVYQIPYAKQKAHYLDGQDDAVVDVDTAKVSLKAGSGSISTSNDGEW